MNERPPQRHLVDPRRQEVHARRRLAVRVGFAALTIATVTACIFEKSDYQGGGRTDKGATAKTAEPTSSTSTTAPTATPDASGADSANPFLDAARGG